MTSTRFCFRGRKQHIPGHISKSRKQHIQTISKKLAKICAINLLNITTSFFLVILILNQLNQQLEISVRSMAVKTLLKTILVLKIRKKPSCIDLIIANRPKCFQNSVTLQTGLSDFHKITLTVMKVFYIKQKLIIVTYRSYKNFSNEVFMFRIECLKWPLKAMTLNLTFRKQYLMKLFKNTLH